MSDSSSAPASWSFSADHFAKEPAAAAALAALAKRKWRVARDAAKELCKKDRPRFLPLLIEANQQLTRELVSKGLLNDARPVLENLRGYAPKELIVELEAVLAVGSISKAPAASSAAAPAATPAAPALAKLLPALAHSAERLRVGESPTARDIRLADCCAVLFSDPIPDQTDPALAGLVRELDALRRAVAAAGDWNWEAMAVASREIPALSPFRHWKVWLRGYRAWFTGDPAEARRLFERLPAHSVTARTAQELMHPGQDRSISQAARAEFYAALAGLRNPATHSKMLLEADAAWRRGKWRDAMRKLQTVFGKHFFDPNFPLESAVADALFDLKDRNRNEAKLLEDAELLDKTIAASPSHDPHLVLRYGRMLGVSDEISGRVDHYVTNWKALSKLLRQVFPGGPLLQAQCDLHLAKVLLQDSDEDDIPLFDRIWCDKSRLAAQLKKRRESMLRAALSATESDPDNEEAWSLLIQIYEKLGRIPDRNRLLDELVERFPRSSNLLYRAGVLAFERKAFTKALKYLESAATLDPLNPKIQSQILNVHVAMLEAAIKKAKPIDGIWNALSKFLDPSPTSLDFNRALWVHKLRRAILEQSKTAHAEALAMAPNECVGLLAEKIILSGERSQKSLQKSQRNMPSNLWGAQELISMVQMMQNGIPAKAYDWGRYGVIDWSCCVFEKAQPPGKNSGEINAYLHLIILLCTHCEELPKRCAIILMQSLGRNFKRWPQSLKKAHPELDILSLSLQASEFSKRTPNSRSINFDKLTALAKDTKNTLLENALKAHEAFWGPTTRRRTDGMDFIDAIEDIFGSDDDDDEDEDEDWDDDEDNILPPIFKKVPTGKTNPPPKPPKLPKPPKPPKPVPGPDPNQLDLPL